MMKQKTLNEVDADNVAGSPQPLHRSDIMLFVASSSAPHSAHVDEKFAKREMWINHLCLVLRLCDVERKARQGHFGVTNVNTNDQPPA